MRKNERVLVGNVYGQLTVINRFSGRAVNATVRCSCGKQYDTQTYALEHGLTTRCRDCGNANKKGKPNLKNRLEGNQRTINRLWNDFRQVAKKKSKNFISKEQWLELIQSSCNFCDSLPNNIKKSDVQYSYDLVYMGIDRIDSSRGYELENVQPACWICNKMKGTLSQDIFIDHVKRIALRSDIISS